MHYACFQCRLPSPEGVVLFDCIIHSLRALVNALFSCADAVRGMVDQILTVGRIVRPALGISIAPVPPMLQQVGDSTADALMCLHDTCVTHAAAAR